MIDIDDPVATRRANHISQQHLAVFDRAAPEVVAIEVQQIEREVGKPVGSALAYGIAQRVQMRHAATVRNGNLTIKYHRRQLGLDQMPERFPEQLVRSYPLRLRYISWPSLGIIATSLWPSCLISCSQLSPPGGLLHAVTI